MNEDREEPTAQGHEPAPGYKNIFYAAFLVTTLYLVIIFVVG